MAPLAPRLRQPCSSQLQGTQCKSASVMCAMQWVDNNDDGHFSPEMWQKGHLRTHWVRVGKVLEMCSGKRPNRNGILF